VDTAAEDMEDTGMMAADEHLIATHLTRRLLVTLSLIVPHLGNRQRN